MKPRVAILMHQRQKASSLGIYAITHLAEFWQEDGIDVRFLAGVEQFVPCDLLIVHVDLSVVPDEYLAFAGQFPRVINGSVRDIRKTSFSHQRLPTDSQYAGPVFVKANLNYGGRPERMLGRHRTTRWTSAIRAPSSRVPYLATSMNYRIYDSITQVPQRFFRGDAAIVEKFLPEEEDGTYHVRTFEFCGDRFTSLRLSSHGPVVKDGTAFAEVEVPPHPEVQAVRQELKLDYGKLDYVIHNDAFHLLDINKTPGASVASDIVREQRRHRATGITSYLT
jgi:hypothetical protein